MSLAGSNRKPALTAAARRITFSRAVADKLREEPWQERAWTVYDRLPAVFYMTRYRSDVASKIEYYVATVEDGADPNLDEGSGAKVLEAEGGPELLRRIVSEFVVHWDVPGEAYLTRFDESPFWRVLSTQELKKVGNTSRFQWGDDTNNLGSIEQDQVYRVWDPHPRFHWQADSPTRHILEDAEELLLLGREAKARSMSRIGAGILWISDGVDISPFGSDEEGDEDDFARELTNRMTQPISDPGSASSVVPWVITAQKEDIAAARHMTFERDWDINLELRKELLGSVATGMDLPPEILTGMADLNHWSAWLVSEQAVSQHVLPTVDAILDSLTSNWFRPLLEASGVDPDLYVLWRDPSPATVPPDQSDVAIRLNELGVISDEATRRVTNFDDEDAASPEELEAKAARRAPAVEEMPADGPPDPIRAAVDPDFVELVAEAVRRLQEGDPPLGRAAVTAAVRRRIVATELADIDAELLTWCQEKADAEIERLLGIVGKSLTAATDPLDESLLTRLAAQLETKIAEAQTAARQWVESLTAKPIDPEPESAFRSQGIQVIIGGILEAVRRRLFTPGASPDPIDTGRIPTVTTPTAAIRQGLSLAGGGPAVYEDGKTSELVGNGQHIHDELEDEGFFQDGYEWKYGHPANTFEPHLYLDGKQFTSWDDPQLAVNFGDSWLRRSHYAPGDHKGCCCAFIQVIVDRQDQIGGLSPERLEELRKAREAFRESARSTAVPVRREASTDFRTAGRRLTDAAPKKYQALFTEAFEDVERTLDGLPPQVRARFIEMMDRMENFKVTTASGWKPGLIQGQFGSTGRVITGKFPELKMETKRFNEDWIRWNVDKVGPEPSLWRTATPEDVASTLVHELTHAHDYWDKIERRATGMPTLSRTLAWEEANMDTRFKLLSGGNPEYTYGASASNEGLAEATRMYLYGEEGRPTATGIVGKSTGQEWRALNPEIARFVEQVVWGF